MNFVGPREILDPLTDAPTGRYRYVRQSNGRAWAIGHCAETRVCPACDGRASWNAHEPWCPRCEHRGFVPVLDSCPGHDTPEGACEHYRQYLLDVATIGLKPDSWLARECAVERCGHPSTHLAYVSPEHQYELCRDHASRESLSGLVRVKGSKEQ